MVSKTEKLRRLTRRHATHQDYQDWQVQVSAETNDRGACLLLTANVEAGLDAAIEQNLMLGGDLPSDLFFEDGPLANFSRKIAMGFALKIYGASTKNNLTIIRHVRNAFAHAKQPIRFSTPEVTDVCNDLLRLPLTPPHIVKADYQSKEGFTPRQLFEDVCNATAHNLFVFSMSPTVAILPAAVSAGLPTGYDRIFAHKIALP